MCNILLVEDDKIQRENVKKIILDSYCNINFYEAEDKHEAIDICRNFNIDIFFLDISLKNSSGVDLAMEIRKIKRYELSWIIFLTTHKQYVIQALKEVHCYDYILKPYNKETLIDITGKLISYNPKKIECEKSRQYIIFELKTRIRIKLYVDEIIFIERSLRKNIIHTINGKYESSKVSFKKILDTINSNEFIQSHKSFAVNINYIRKIDRIDSRLWEIKFENYDKIALLGYKFKNAIMNKFK